LNADRTRFGLLIGCLLLSLALYGALAVILGSVPPGWNCPVGFALPTAPLFQSFTGLPVVALSAPGWERAMAAVLILLWGCWAAALLLLRGIEDPVIRGRATTTIVVGGAAMLLLVAICAPPILSSDLFRQAAYGRMVAAHHLNPYATAVDAIPGDPVFPLANHRHLTTHYGPAYTLLSAIAAAVAPASALGIALAWKVMSAIAAIGCALLAAPVARALGGDEADAQTAQLWLAWNPLLLIESAVSGHVEPIMMCAALAGILLWQRGRPVRGAAALLLSTLTKWVSGLLFVFAAARDVYRAGAGRRARAAAGLAGRAALLVALLYLPFSKGLLAKRGGISDLALRGSATVGSGAVSVVPQWALLAAFAVAVLATMRFVMRGDWPRLVAATTALALVFVALVNPWPFPWYFVTPLVLAATLPKGRAGFALRGLTAGIGGASLLMYAKLIPWS